MATPTIISLREARAKGLIRYYTGKPCKWGHLCERQVSSRNCCECHRWLSRKSNRKYQQANPDKIAAKVARRRAAKKLATPPWSLEGFHKDRIDEFYEDSALFRWALKLPFEVDHIISLFNGGLHVFWNLQHLTQSVNASKGTQDDAYVYPKPTFNRVTYRTHRGRVDA